MIEGIAGGNCLEYEKGGAQGLKVERRGCMEIVGVKESESDDTVDIDVVERGTVEEEVGGLRGAALDFLGGGFEEAPREGLIVGDDEVKVGGANESEAAGDNEWNTEEIGGISWISWGINGFSTCSSSSESSNAVISAAVRFKAGLEE